MFGLSLSASLAVSLLAAPRSDNAQGPDDFNHNHAQGEYLLKNQKIAAAIPYLEQAWKINPSNYANAYDLALAYLDSGATEKSRGVIESLIKREDKAELHNLLGDVEEAEGHVDQAAHQYETAARLDPSEKNLFDLGSDLLKHRGFSPALKVFQFGVERYPASAGIRVGLGIAYYSLGQYEQAVQTLCDAVDLNPRDVKALDFLGKMYDVAPEYADEVTKRLARFATLYPENSAANYYYALSLRRRGSTGTGMSDVDNGSREAEKYLLRTLELRPDFADAHYELGLLYEDEKRARDAIRQFELATKSAPDLLKAHYRLAQLYQQSGQSELARKEFQAVKALKGHE